MLLRDVPSEKVALRVLRVAVPGVQVAFVALRVAVPGVRVALGVSGKVSDRVRAWTR